MNGVSTILSRVMRHTVALVEAYMIYVGGRNARVATFYCRYRRCAMESIVRRNHVSVASVVEVLCGVSCFK